MKSLRGRNWNILRANPEALEEMKSIVSDPIIARLLVGRSIPAQEASAFLYPTIRDLLPKPNILPDMAKAVNRTLEALSLKQHIWVWGDYDVDGACSTALIVQLLRALGATVSFRIPDRISEGYGPNSSGVQRIVQSGGELLIIVDSGTVAFEPIDVANKAGLDVIVLDHHVPHDTLPKAVAVVNPNRRDAQPGFEHLCAAGVCFLFAVALVKALQEQGRKDCPNLLDYLDLVGLATVCDVVSLTGVNRAFVRTGLLVLNKGHRAGIHALCRVAGIKDKVSPYHCGYLLGPRINAGGRVGDAEAGTRLLLEEDSDRAYDCARSLDSWNQERQLIEKHCLNEALNQKHEGSIRVVSGKDWHEGVVGIVAARLKERYDVPAFVFGGAGHGVFKGSGRSVRGFDLGTAVGEAFHAGLLVKGGGHPMAAGATILEENLEPFRMFLAQRFQNSPAGRDGVPVDVDLVVSPSLITEVLVDAGQALEPFGQGNSRPRIVVPNVKIISASLLKETHLKLEVVDVSTNKRLKAVAFGVSNTTFCDVLLSSAGKHVDLYGTLQINEWQNQRNVEMILEDARFAQIEESVPINSTMIVG